MLLYTGSHDSIVKPTLHTASLGNIGLVRASSQQVLTLREHGRRDWSMFYCISGSMTFNDSILESDGFWIYPPDVRHAYHINSADTAYYYIHFTGSCMQELMEELHLPFCTCFRPSHQFDSSALKQLFMLFHAKDSASLDIEWRFLRLLSAIASSTGKHPVTDRFSTILDEMVHNFPEPFDVQYYASELGVSVSRFNHLFKQNTGVSPLQYYTALRIENAEHLLKYTDLPINKIAASVGYEDPLYFDRVFKKQLNCSPKEYRKAAAVSNPD